MNQQTVHENYWSRLIVNFLSATIFATIFVGILFMMGYTVLKHDSICNTGILNNINFLEQIICWVDPIFSIYNLFLLLLLAMIVPAITLFYVRTMRPRKEERLWKSVPKNEENKKKVNQCLDKTFKMSHYAGSMTLLSIVIMLGGMIILLLKPMAISDIMSGNGYGVDFRKGANFLMLGSYMHYYIDGNIQDHMRVLVGTLTAFQFGFLGAYTYFITHLVRSYFTFDLSPNIYISCTVRIMMGAVLSLIMSFVFISGQFGEDITNAAPAAVQSAMQDNVQTVSDSPESTNANNEAQTGLVITSYYYYLPVLSFFIGFFPARGLLLIERTAGSLLHLLPINYNSTSLTKLTGMSYQHEARLNREGFDNVENFVDADVLNLAIYTGFSYKQLCDWRSQAKLISCLGDDYTRFKQATSIDSADKLQTNASWFDGATNDAALTGIIDESLYQKTKIVLNTIQQDEAP